MRVWTEDDVLRVLWRHFLGQAWSAVPQVTVSMLDSHPEFEGIAHEYADATDRRIDLLAIRTHQDPVRHESLAIEVKVTRADFLTDVHNPAKQAAWKAAANRHAYAVPSGLVKVDEVPADSGLLYVKSHGSTDWGWAEWATPAPSRHERPLPERVWTALLSRASGLDGQTRGWATGPEAAGTPQQLRASLQAAHRATERAERRAAAAEGQVGAWKAAYAMASADGHPCVWCGKPVKPLRPTKTWFQSWRHIDKADDEPCRLAQQVLGEQEARAEYAEADEGLRARAVRLAHATHRDRFNPAVEREPWRAFVHDINPPAPAGEAPREDAP